MNMLNDANTQETNTEMKLQKNVRHNMVKIFKCSECGLTFDRASQLGYHHRSIHLGERSQVCQICGKGFFRKADLRTHLNVHLGTNFCICEFCGRRFNHISNLIRHCRVHAGVKPYLCSICDRRFTQVSSLVRHKQIIHGIPKESMRQYCSSSLISNKSQVTEHVSKENEMTDNNVKDRYHEKISAESKCQSTDREVDAQNKDKISNQHNIDTNNTAVTAYLPLETVIYVTSKQFEEDNLAEIEHRLSQDYLAGIEEKLQSIDLSTSKTVVSSPPQDAACNHEQAQSKDNIIHQHQLDKNSFTFLPRDRGPGDAEARAIQDFKQDSVARSDVGKLDMGTNLQTCDSDEVSADPKFLHKQMCKETINEDRKCEKASLNDDNQLYIELSELGLLKFDESRYCGNTDLDTVKSEHSANLAANNLTYAPVSAENQESLPRNEGNQEVLSNPGNIALNNEDPMLRMVQTEAGEQFYEFISNLVEKMQDNSSVENTGNKVEEPSSTFEHCRSNDSRDTREDNEKNGRTEHQQTLEDLTDINHEFNYTQFDFHRDEKSFTVLCDHESGHFQQDSRENCATALQEKNLQTYGSGNLELLENESHVDFDKYVETNFEVFERLNYENCNERFFEFVEVADIGVESSSSASKESPMVCLVQNDGDQLLELLQDCQITEQESDFASSSKLDGDCSNVLQDNDKIADCPEGKPDFFAYVEPGALLKEDMSNERGTADSGNSLYTDLMINNDMSVSNGSVSDESRVGTSKEAKKPEKSEKPEKSKSSPKKYQCSVCKKAFSTAYNYKQHIGIHFTDQQKFHCKECGVSFAWKSTLNKHIASTHSSNWPPKFVCDICPRVYSTLSQVNEHVKRDHLKQRNHVCDHCGKSFFKSFDLKTHSRTHTNERPYACRVCGKRFHYQSHIIRHERTHSGERPYVCVVCQKAFIQPGSLKVHEQKHRLLRMDILNYQIDEDDPIALMTL
ncbi:uncharacterized protein LOC105192357 isoform X2 [Harpegnathos saltator]|uniref:uncharacterized protein LOC105192357 isoform X2 n=1 Tax=Harpegnathos saltator TaxID=610380 RepID=UPI00058B8236|nr:uncharacterized protein LOC105192357 isoform X2 [Harpegnathos saltator]